MSVRFIIGTFLVLAALSGPSATAQTDPLSQLCENFIAQSGTPMSGNTTALCTCLVTEIQKQLSVADMQAYQRATAAGQELSPALRSKVTSIAAQCLAASK